MDRQKLLTGLGVEQVGKSIYLVYRSSTDLQNTIRLARSTDGFDFSLVKLIKDDYKSEGIPKGI
ncbi:MAG TPA: hypothetical protein VF828_03320, partial [Patescibacteria group bacterium]